MKKGSDIIADLKSIRKNLGFYIGYSWRMAKESFILSMINIIVLSVQPFIMLILPAKIIDELSGKCRWRETLILILCFIVVEVILAITNSVTSYLSTLFAMRSRVNTWMEYDRRWIRMDYENMENSNIRDLGSKIEDNVSALNFIATISPLLVNIIQLVGYAYIISMLHPLMLGLILVLVCVSAHISKKTELLQFEFSSVIAKFTRRVNYLFRTMIDFSYGKEIRINNLSTWLKNRFNREVDQYLTPFAQRQKKELGLGFITTLSALGQTVVSYGYCVYEVIKGYISLGTFSMYLGAITAFMGSISGLSGKIARLVSLSKYIDDYKRFYEMTEPRYLNANIKLSDENVTKHEFEFCDVSFQYPNTERLVLKHINIKIATGEKLSIVGYNGAGKTTFIKLLCRLYVPTEGKILYNGIDIQTIDYDDYRKLLGVVFQDFKLFSMSVRENIVLDQAEIPVHLEAAVEESGLTEKINGLPQGMNTQIGRQFDASGVEFSGGEGQKLACARAYYRNAPIVVLDEPTASLDPVSEHRLYERFHKIMDGKTAIYISHRLASVRFCDKVAVFVDGEIVEYGKHLDLIAQKGVYAEMFSKQSEFYIGEGGGTDVRE